MDEKLRLLSHSFGEDKIKLEEDLKYHLASRVGGKARLFVVALNERELIRLLQIIHSLELEYIVIGTGSKIDLTAGFAGVVVKSRSQNIKIVSIKGKVGKGNVGVESVMLELEGGVTITDLITFLKKQGLRSDYFEGMRGSIGGNIFTNLVLRDLSDRVRILNLDDEIEIISSAELDLRLHTVLSVVLKVDHI